MSSTSRNDIPVLLCAFNRPEMAATVLMGIREARPSILYFAVDGPRAHEPKDRNRVAAVRSLAELVDWHCDLRVRFADENWGAGRAIERSIDWFFEEQERGIILEDDCVPSAAFFDFCGAVLNKCQSNPDVWLACGTNQVADWRSDEVDVFFSEPHIWGWATWRDRWRRRDRSLITGVDVHESNLAEYYGPNWWYRRKLIDLAVRGEVDAWDIQWLYVVALNGGLCALPSRNLITNIGHGPDATHTRGSSRFGNLVGIRDLPSWSRFDVAEFDREFQAKWAVAIRREYRQHDVRRRMARLWSYAAKVTKLPRRLGPGEDSG